VKTPVGKIEIYTRPSKTLSEAEELDLEGLLAEAPANV